MSKLIDRLPLLLEESIEDLPYLKENAKNQKKDKTGSASNLLGYVLRFIGVAGYVVNSDVDYFKSFLQNSAKIRIQLLNRFEREKLISKSYVSMISYKSLFTALASGDIELSKQLAVLSGGRDKIEVEYDHPFDLTLGYALKSLVLNSDDQAEKISQFKVVVSSDSDNSDFVGYVEGFEAIYTGNVELFFNAMKKVISGHKRQCKGSGVFKDTEDEVLCVWGLGLINLAIARGMSVEFIDSLIPKPLIIS